MAPAKVSFGSLSADDDDDDDAVFELVRGVATSDGAACVSYGAAAEAHYAPCEPQDFLDVAWPLSFRRDETADPPDNHGRTRVPAYADVA